jgi:hypothetical protein
MILDFYCSSFQLVGTYLIKTAAADQTIDGESSIVDDSSVQVGGLLTALDCY